MRPTKQTLPDPCGSQAERYGVLTAKGTEGGLKGVDVHATTWAQARSKGNACAAKCKRNLMTLQISNKGFVEKFSFYKRLERSCIAITSRCEVLVASSKWYMVRWDDWWHEILGQATLKSMVILYFSILRRKEARISFETKQKCAGRQIITYGAEQEVFFVDLMMGWHWLFGNCLGTVFLHLSTPIMTIVVPQIQAQRCNPNTHHNQCIVR